MELKILYTALPQGMDSDGLKRGLDEVLEDSGWLTGSGPGWVELELEDERQNPEEVGGRKAEPQIRHSGGQALPPARRPAPGHAD